MDEICECEKGNSVANGWVSCSYKSHLKVEGSQKIKIKNKIKVESFLWQHAEKHISEMLTCWPEGKQ